MTTTLFDNARLIETLDQQTIDEPEPKRPSSWQSLEAFELDDSQKKVIAKILFFIFVIEEITRAQPGIRMSPLGPAPCIEPASIVDIMANIILLPHILPEVLQIMKHKGT